MADDFYVGFIPDPSVDCLVGGLVSLKAYISGYHDFRNYHLDTPCLYVRFEGFGFRDITIPSLPHIL